MHQPLRSFAKPGTHDTEPRNDPPLEKSLVGEEKLPRMDFLRTILPSSFRQVPRLLHKGTGSSRNPVPCEKTLDSRRSLSRTPIRGGNDNKSTY